MRVSEVVAAVEFQLQREMDRSVIAVARNLDPSAGFLLAFVDSDNSTRSHG